jgi:hypothetical protein
MEDKVEDNKQQITKQQKEYVLLESLLKTATILTDLNHIEDRNIILDMADRYCDEALKEYMDGLDKEVVSIIDDVENMLKENNSGDDK